MIHRGIPIADVILDWHDAPLLEPHPFYSCFAFDSADKTNRAELPQASGRVSLMTSSRFSSAKSEIPFTTIQAGSSGGETATSPTPSISPPTIGSSLAGIALTSSSRNLLLKIAAPPESIAPMWTWNG